MSLEFGLTVTLLGVAYVFLALTLVAVACRILKKVFKEEKSELAPSVAPLLEERPRVKAPTKESRDFRIALEGEEHEVMVEDAGVIGEELEDVTPTFKIERDIKVVVGGKEFEAKVEEVGVIPCISPIAERKVQLKEARIKEAAEKEGGKVIQAPMRGTIIRIPVKVGDKVEEGEVLVVLEVMKMENEIKSSISGIVRAIRVSEGDEVATGDILVVLD